LGVVVVVVVVVMLFHPLFLSFLFLSPFERLKPLHFTLSHRKKQAEVVQKGKA